MSKETFRNAPLVEIIAEVRWSISAVKSIPNGGIDPFYESLRSALVESLGREGFSTVIDTVPLDVPREFLAGQVTTQYRLAANQWPLYQLGPGIFTANITEGYTGWESFRGHLARGIEHLLRSHPAPKVFSIQALKLIAIDAYTKKHGYTSYSDFTSKLLPLGEVLNQDFIEKFATDSELVKVRSESVFPLRRMSGSFARISIGDGIKDDGPALLVHTTVEVNREFRPDALELQQWFDEAHTQHREMFRSLLSTELYSILEPEVVKI